MKSIIKYSICLIFASLVMSCNYLDIIPDNIPTLDDAFANRYTAEQYLATCYWGLPKAADGIRIQLFWVRWRSS